MALTNEDLQAIQELFIAERTYTSELMDAKLEGALASVDTKLEGALASVDARLEGALASVDAKLEGALASVDAKLEGALASVDTKLEGALASVDAKLEGALAPIREQQEVHTRAIMSLENKMMHELKMLNELLPDAVAKRKAFEEVSAKVYDHDGRIFALEQKASS